EHHQAVACGEMIEPVSQRPDRLRRVVAMGPRRRDLALLQRFVGLGHGPACLCASPLQRCIIAARRGQLGRRIECRPMLDLGTSFLASVARDPEALAIVDGDLRLTYSAWYLKISALVAGFDALGLARGHHLVTVLQTRWEAATLHWACQFAGIIIAPVNWRATADGLDFCLQDAEAKAVVYEGVSCEAVRASRQASRRIAVGEPHAQDVPFESLIGRN